MEKIEKPTILTFFSSLFGNNEGYEDIENVEIKDSEQLKAQRIADKLGIATAEQPVVADNKTSKNGGFSNGLSRLDKTTMKAMRAKYNETVIKDGRNDENTSKAKDDQEIEH